jgi:xylulose-5-phosphate/fructose-6-phosphate phosphoketolase
VRAAFERTRNGLTHHASGFLDHVINKKADIVRVYLPVDANCLLSVFDHCLRSRKGVNISDPEAIISAIIP